MEDFSRRTMGSERLDDKESCFRGVSEWFEDGWRAVDREPEYVEIAVDDDRATVRRIGHETYRGPDVDRNASGAAVAETWVRRNGKRFLWRVNAQSLDD